MKPRSQSDRIIDWLASGRSLTPYQALARFGCMRLGARIWQLKRDGHRIQAEMVRRGGKSFAQYRLAR